MVVGIVSLVLLAVAAAVVYAVNVSGSTSS
jgi:hypothetical protein